MNNAINQQPSQIEQALRLQSQALPVHSRIPYAEKPLDI
jgi:hypothetical protein